MYLFTLESAIKAHDSDNLIQWSVDYMRHEEGHNRRLADAIEQRDIVYTDLLEYPLSKLVRIAGPEKNMKFKADKEPWHAAVNTLTQKIEKGIKLPPLIATDFWKDLHLADGAHRHEALLNAGKKTYWTIFLVKDIRNKPIPFEAS